MIKLYQFLLLFSAIALLYACKKDLEAEIPSYININSIAVEDSSGNVVSSNIKDAWVYVNDKFKGVYELPTSLPIIENGQNKIEVRAGVEESGMTEFKLVYPFYTPYSTTVELHDEMAYTINPVVNYSSITKINASEWTGADFEGGINLNKSNTSDTSLIRTTAPASSIYGDYVGTFYLSNQDSYFEAVSEKIINIPRNGTAVWLEMDYISDVTIEVGLYQNDMDNQYPVAYFKPQSNWTKIYIDLNDAILSFPGAPNYNLYIAALKEGSKSVTSTSLDNIKLLHY